MTLRAPRCPFSVGDRVTFQPSLRTSGVYQNLEGFGVRVGQTVTITEILEDTYLYFENGAGGWPWNEFVKAS